MTSRQEIILNLLSDKGGAKIKEIINAVNSNTKKSITKITINRDLDILINEKTVIRIGAGPATHYKLTSGYELFKDIKRDIYFSNPPDIRKIKENFNFDVFITLNSVEIFNENELKYLNELTDEYRGNIKNLPNDILQKEFERITIELSWKSSHIEGNTYDLLETENLIKGNHEARGHTKKEAIMILNHKKTFDYIKKNSSTFKQISSSKIEDIHYFLTKNMDISRNIRSRLVGITGTKYRPLDNKFQIEDALKQTCDLTNDKQDFYSKSLLLNILIAYIQPFGDGNKRTSRLLGNALLMANNSCPLSFRSIDETEYKKAIILFYEQNNLKYFKELFIEQFEFAVKNYFL